MLKRGRPPGIKVCPEFEYPRWWTERFISHVGKIAAAGQINAAKRYVRAGKVVNLAVSPGLIEARVQGGRKTPYFVRLFFPCPSGERISDIKHALCQKAIYRSMLLSGEMPVELDNIFKASGAVLTLETFSGSQGICGCPEPDETCKHILAAIFVAAAAFDRDPFLLLRLRGLDKDDLLKSLIAPVADDRRTRGEQDDVLQESAEKSATDEENDENTLSSDASFYGSDNLSEELKSFRRGLARDGHSTPIFDFPFWKGESSFIETITPYYKNIENFLKGQ